MDRNFFANRQHSVSKLLTAIGLIIMLLFGLFANHTAQATPAQEHLKDAIHLPSQGAPAHHVAKLASDGPTTVVFK